MREAEFGGKGLLRGTLRQGALHFPVAPPAFALFLSPFFRLGRGLLFGDLAEWLRRYVEEFVNESLANEIVVRNGVGSSLGV